MFTTIFVINSKLIISQFDIPIIAIDATETKPFILISFINFETDCTQRSRVYIMEGGKQQVIYYCGRKQIKNYISKTGKASVGIDIGKNSKILIRYHTNEMIKSTSNTPVRALDNVFIFSYSAIAKTEYIKYAGIPKPVNIRRLAASRSPQMPQLPPQPDTVGQGLTGNSAKTSFSPAPKRNPKSRYSSAGRIRYIPYKGQKTFATFSVSTTDNPIHLKHSNQM